MSQIAIAFSFDLEILIAIIGLLVAIWKFFKHLDFEKMQVVLSLFSSFDYKGLSESLKRNNSPSEIQEVFMKLGTIAILVENVKSDFLVPYIWILNDIFKVALDKADILIKEKTGFERDSLILIKKKILNAKEILSKILNKFSKHYE